MCCCILLIAGDPFHGRILLAGTPISLISLIALNCITDFLLMAMVFGLTYFSTVVVKHSRGLLLSVGILVGYLVLRAVMSHYFSLSLPSLLAPEFAISGQRDVTGFADHLGLSLAVRTAVVLLFPVAAQMVLEKADL
jgi:hypothetical protein